MIQHLLLLFICPQRQSASCCALINPGPPLPPSVAFLPAGLWRGSSSSLLVVWITLSSAADILGFWFLGESLSQHFLQAVEGFHDTLLAFAPGFQPLLGFSYKSGGNSIAPVSSGLCIPPQPTDCSVVIQSVLNIFLLLGPSPLSSSIVHPL